MRSAAAGAILLALGFVFSTAVAAQTPEKPCPIYEMRSFVAYFEADRAELATDATNVVEVFAEFVTQWNEGQPDRCFGPIETIILAGHTDTVGDSDANMGLSRQRVEAVTARLHALGIIIPIEVQAYGETRLSVTTADNVREPLNNRVSMDYVWSVPEKE